MSENNVSVSGVSIRFDHVMEIVIDTVQHLPKEDKVRFVKYLEARNQDVYWRDDGGSAELHAVIDLIEQLGLEEDAPPMSEIRASVPPTCAVAAQ